MACTHDFDTIRAKERERNDALGRLEGSSLSDVHLLFPCSYFQDETEDGENIEETEQLLSYEQLFHVASDEEREECKFFLDKMKVYNNSEMTGTFTRKIKRADLGFHTFVVPYADKDYEIEGMLYCSKHQLSEVGMVSAIFLYSSLPASLLLTALCAGVLKIKEQEQTLSFSKWMKERGMMIAGMPKSVVFEYDKVSRRDIINCLACEYEPMAEITGDTFKEWSQENFAQYDVAKVHASDTCLFYEMSQKIEDVCERLNQEAVELFFIELLMMQEAAVNVVCDEVYTYLNNRTTVKENNDNISLFALSQKAANAILFVDYKELRFPTVRVSAQRIAERFGFKEDMEKYYKCREVLEQMISIDSVESETIENRLMNLLLLILTMLQVLPTLSQIAYAIMTGDIHLKSIGSGVIGTIGCIVLYSIYRLSYARARKRCKERLYGNKRRKQS